MIGFIILNYNTWKTTIECVNSIISFVKEEFRIYVVDNNSPDQITSKDYEFLTSDNRVVVIMHKENKGYSAGNNVGIKLAIEDGCDFITICNSDVLFVDDSISKMKGFLVGNPTAGIVGPLLYDQNGDFQPIYMRCKLTGVGKIKNMLLHTKASFLFRRFEKSFICYEETDVPMKVFGVSGCCFMMSRECAKFLYPLDEETFLYEEEYIIGARIEKTSFSVYVVPSTHVIHKHSVSIGGLSKFSYKCMMDSEQYYLKKYIKTPFFLRHLILLIRKIRLKRIGKA